MQSRRIFQREGNMPVAMQGKLVSFLMDVPNEFCILLYAFPYQVECGTYLMSSQHSQQGQCILRVWTIVKSQCDPVAYAITLIEDFRVTALSSQIETMEGCGQNTHDIAFQLYDIVEKGTFGSPPGLEMKIAIN